MLLTNALAGLLLAGYASAKATPVHALFQRSDHLEHVLRRDAEFMASLTRRQDSNGASASQQASPVPASGDASKIDLAKWEEQTKAACGTALQSLNGQASNPSGIAVCYNLPFLDNQTGVFQAELRMYNISAPIDPWTGITAADVSMTLSYSGATVQNMNGSYAKREISWPPIKVREVDGMLVKKQNNGMTELKVLMYVGQINKNLMGTAMTQATLQPLLIPKIELTAKSPSSGQEVKATLASQEASFVNGIFAKEQAASAQPAQASAPPFVLPGTQLAFFPTGLLVTCIWMAGFVGAVGLGTYGRIQFRDQYRRRIKNEAARNVRTI
ncbi:hypothetical protein K458DRAFT_303436 [Lentithecium fluviatile CBS 122367]|uniref:Uncharacterized protein n=1 Tax=Lentithecium fluviatile CBS 122367 TaxID=1168545 RepID=A0A6G1J162_9PLEO|nr:hypothetical protein K458DRAFT_303436 [Lentithecium fluviatile CBS 122367]